MLIRCRVRVLLRTYRMRRTVNNNRAALKKNFRKCQSHYRDLHSAVDTGLSMRRCTTFILVWVVLCFMPEYDHGYATHESLLQSQVAALQSQHIAALQTASNAAGPEAKPRINSEYAMPRKRVGGSTMKTAKAAIKKNFRKCQSHYRDLHSAVDTRLSTRGCATFILVWVVLCFMPEYDRGSASHEACDAAVAAAGVVLIVSVCVRSIRFAATVASFSGITQENSEYAMPRKRNSEYAMPRKRVGGSTMKTAKVWRFFDELPTPEQAAECRLCRKKIKATNSSTTGMIRHLRSCHVQEYQQVQEARQSTLILKMVFKKHLRIQAKLIFKRQIRRLGFKNQ
ncbi:BED zinc finger [Oesophagostomum dentatum]|uniref:BED zinc finger n=1 Tax=Oesophagostomum dentatum TaxID=61180 RepID=A0A0B1TIX2_OESDE|nr:BED zinc finger [Oesophagostomum dentatum]